ncbi:hypothetical protein EPA93_24900 [Ktedonosporobacter rubrisoli]|uniref:Uncharacterized protein n=1 Tax=Ktedonosporobacter rubrisoli TaxID=2509675 RepID=A0A4P6JTX7_KTERU|nr:DUF6062 family protein [Ktedonosporobacter rubrisoli]QBD79047.1 hypothetical protein EPA93_24900 [Ktedonosporobacter rubrisoli]
MQRTQEYQTLLYACQQEGCPICRLLQESTQRYLRAWQYEHFTDVGIREELRRTRGFCHTHTWQLVHLGAALPIAQAYRDIISDIIEQLQSGQHEVQPPSGSLLRRFFEAKQEASRCPACQQQRKAEERYISSLRQALLDEAFYAQFTESQGLCLPHFQLASTLKLSSTPGDWLARLRKAQLSCLQRLDGQLGELIRKHDYRFKDEPRGPEMKSWQRAAGLVAGEE